MAARALSEDDVRRLTPLEPGRPLGFLYLLDTEEPPAWRTKAFVLRVRRGGFLVGVPVEPRVSSTITALGSENTEDVIIFRTASVEAETPRRRAVGEVEIILTDVPWSYLGMFRKPAAARASEQPELIPFRKDGVVVRPVRESAIGAAEAWINDVMDDPALIEYQTAESHNDEEAEDEEGGAPEAEDLSSEVVRLRAQVAELRGLTTQPATTARPGAQRGARTLFPEGPQATRGQLSEEQWQRLRAAAGPAPGRMARHERQPRAVAAELAEGELAEVEAGARPEDLSGEGSLLQQLLSTQTKLLERLAGRNQDPITAALSGPSGSSETGMGSAKGITAREAYVKLMQQQPAQVSSAIRSAAAAEMGVDIASPPSSLMRSYVERKMVIGDHRQLALFAHYLAHCWEAARESGNEEMEYWMSRGLLMVDQFGVDQGRTTVGWLLAANCAYLKDCDYLEGRLKSAGVTTTTTQGDQQAEGDAGNEDKPRRPPRRPRKAGQTGDTTA